MSGEFWLFLTAAVLIILAFAAQVFRPRGMGDGASAQNTSVIEQLAAQMASVRIENQSVKAENRQLKIKIEQQDQKIEQQELEIQVLRDTINDLKAKLKHNGIVDTDKTIRFDIVGEMRRMIDDRLNHTEIRALAQDLGIDYAKFNNASLALDFMDAVNRRGLLVPLLVLLKQEYGDFEWPKT